MTFAKHFFESQAGLVVKSIKGLAAQNPSLAVDEQHKILYNVLHDPSQITALSGGGAGHEPGHGGFVGDGMLAAAVYGEVFASPNTNQIIRACQLCPSNKGYLMIVTNYTGDMLHFGLALEKLRAKGVNNVAIIQAADDVSVGPENKSVGRRGLAGAIFLNKIVGAAIRENQLTFDQMKNYGNAVGGALVTINVGLDHCHVPGHSEEQTYKLGPTQCEIGLGIHNEPGVQVLDEIPPVDHLIKTLLAKLISGTGSRDQFLHFDKGDEVALMINNLGAIPLIEQNALVHEVMNALAKTYDIVPSRVYSGHFMTSLNAPIFSITLLNVTKCTGIVPQISENDVIRHLDAATDALSWPRNHYDADFLKELRATAKTNSTLNQENGYINKSLNEAVAVESDNKSDIKVDGKLMEDKLRAAAENVIQMEPKLTAWDTEMGDGDCGRTLENGCRELLRQLDSKLIDTSSLRTVVDTIAHITEEFMGGTLGAIFAIFFSALHSGIQETLKRTHEEIETLSTQDILATSSQIALQSLTRHTTAREGDRTVMDVIIPYVSALNDTHDIKTSLSVAHVAAKGTTLLKPKRGRATYVGIASDRVEFPPDPGAWALYEILRGLTE